MRGEAVLPLAAYSDFIYSLALSKDKEVMRMRLLITSLLLMISIHAAAMSGHMGGTFSYRSKDIQHRGEPNDVYGFRGAVWYEAEKAHHKLLHVYWDASVAHWRSHKNLAHTSINIFALAPIFRLYLIETDILSPYVEASVGPAYLSKTQFANQKLGVRFTFQDTGGIGVAFGKDKRYEAGIHVVHYSNAEISSTNQGITVPFMFRVVARVT